jgi:plasmid stability protein
MATIQVRELPEETYEIIRKRARARGMSIQAYMRERVIEWESRPTKAELLASVDEILESADTPGGSPEQNLRDLRELRGE